MRGVIMRGYVMGGQRRTIAHVRSGPGGLTCEPGTTRSFREPLIWLTRVPISSCSPTARIEQSEPHSGVNRRPERRARYRSPSRAIGLCGQSTLKVRCRCADKFAWLRWARKRQGSEDQEVWLDRRGSRRPERDWKCMRCKPVKRFRSPYPQLDGVDSIVNRP